MKRAVVVLIGFLFFVVGLWSIAIPESLIVDLIEGSLSRDYIYLRIKGLEKGLFYNFSAEEILLKKRGAGGDSEDFLLQFKNVSGRLDFMSLLELSPELSFDCGMNGGDIRGEIRLAGDRDVRINGSAISIKGIPFLEPLGIRGEGIMSGDFSLRDGRGELRFSVSGLRLDNASFGGVFLPLEIFGGIKGAAAISGETVEVRSFAMSGKGAYARVRGNIKGGRMDMTFELMTDSSFTLEPFFGALLEPYRVSPGYYAVPLRGEAPFSRGE